MEANPTAARTGSSSAVPPVRATVYVSRWPKIPHGDWPGMPDGMTFSPTTSTLVTGATEAVLIDAQYLKDDVRDLGDLIERTGKKLTTIYLTHGHPDHYLGVNPLLERFPDAKCVALPGVIKFMQHIHEDNMVAWQVLFGDATVLEKPRVEPLEDLTLYVDGTPLHVIEVKQADIHPTTVVHIPAAGAVVAGDSIYNEIHQMFGLSGPEDWQAWLETVDLVEGLHPRMIVAGHRRPDGDDYAVDTIIAQTRSYIHDFAAAYEVAKDADDLIATMTAKYPHHGNFWTLWFSATNAIELRDTGRPSPVVADQVGY